MGLNDKMGGPAFPHGNPEQGGDPGMTLWDYYAAAALSCVRRCPNSGTNNVEMTAEIAADMADQMIAERAKRMEQGND